MLGDKKPKFRFSFSINDLSKIPHTSGYCYAELSVADGNPSRFHSDLSSVSSSGASLNLENKASSHSSTRRIQVRTPRYRIHNFKCQFNFSMTCNLKFSLRRKDDMLGDKYILLRVYYITEKHSRHDHPMELGEVKLNLTEYLNFREPVTAKYLLQESKVNSILNLTISLEELPADFEFHTQLSIDNSKHTQPNTSSSLGISSASEKGTKSFNVPQFQRQAVFGGLDGVINPQANKETGRSLPQQADSVSGAQSEDEEADGENTLQPDRHITSVGTKPIEDVIVDPIIGSLYRKILESSWDPDLHVLLKLTPQKVVDDIFDLEKDPSKMESNLQHYRDLRPADNDDLKNVDGLMIESKFRNNLKSWSVSWT
ncbi:hypothetical protein METBIDRAFT_41576 [Metschnikowia bicuspidata var. bicuspidata NRRL YB-4993]|uniref:C2 NT-type domain-containing protein n=1 Tax=Metschnikowia bicuspidata var. bicuspidata NRRL YB-4993 TaxID=869754 RepID=A0A1A0HCT5_9ASCO|nr:hypothetical protein METBIDRAFT_41576 [Metschnikowia bicuspidata var. bicuspidata NRRL YB-4993]OBA21707.1 hypothetical protein METBIDRAFT_41576 [Metschnikowia bicuspidata var. bicuspidata NRRL YB-4993]